MKLKSIRLVVQLLCVLLTVIGFFTSVQLTVIVLMAATLAAGAFYCGWICPYGTLQDLFSSVGTKLGIRKKKMPKQVHTYLKYVRILIFAIVILSASDLIFNIMSYDPRGSLAAFLGGNTLSTLSIVVLLSFAFIGVVFERPFCNYFCYEGAKYGLLSSVRIFTVKRAEVSCIGCKKCDKACPMNIQVSQCHQLRSIQCINCLECVQACPVQNTLTYGRIDFNKNERKRYGIILILLVVGVIGLLSFKLIKGGSLSTNADSAVADDSETLSEYALTEEELALLGEAEGISDGTYIGSAEGYKGTVTVEITVVRQMITQVSVTDNRDDRKWFQRAESVIPDSIVETQSTEISAVSGATYSSEGIINAVKNALENAGQ